VARTIPLAVCLGLALAAAPARAQEAYTLRLKPAGDGETTRFEDSLTTEMSTRQTDASGYPVGGRKDRSVRRAVYQETILKRDPATGAVTGLRRQCETATLEINKNETPLPYHGKTFTVERGPDGCRVRFEGTPPPEDFVRELEEGFARKKDVNLLDAMLPRKAVRPGETWNFDAKPLLLAWPKPGQVRVNPDAAVGTGKLTKVARQDGRLVGVLEFGVEVPVLGVDFGTRAATLEPGARRTVVLTVEGCLDGTASTLTVRMQDELRVRVQLPSPSGQRITGTLSEQHIRTETRP
jgi:hypothetical protein